MDHSPPGSSVHRILQGKILEWVSVSSSMWSSRPRDWKNIFCTSGRFFFKFFLLKDNCFTEFFFLLSVKPQHESVIGIHIYPPFWTSLPSPTTFYVSRGIQNPCLSFLSHIFAVSNSKLLLDIYFTYSNVSFHVILSKHLPFSSPSPPLSPCP